MHFPMPDGTSLRIEQKGNSSYAIMLNADGSERWKKGAPLDAQWENFWKIPDVLDRVQRGRYCYLNGVDGNSIYVVFQPYAGLDFNIIFEAMTGAIIGLTPAR